MTDRQTLQNLIENQRSFFRTGATLPRDARIKSLKRLDAALTRYEDAFHTALKQDLNKSEYEAFFTETGFCRHDLRNTIKQLGRWMKPRRAATPLTVQPGTSQIRYEPRGVNLVISPYNYPVLLTYMPLTAAIAAGNTAVVKPSELTPRCTEVTRQLIETTFDPGLVACVTGEVRETTLLLEQDVDHIFFTGSPRVGSIVMAAAAKHLTPVTLELGGKSPCIVHRDAPLDLAAKRIVHGKFINAGQTCVAPDYLLVHTEIKEAFLETIRKRIIRCFGTDPARSPDFGRIINSVHFRRIAAMIDPARVVVGGETHPGTRYIAPTVLRDMTLDDAAMKEEIFGPVLPVLDYTDTDDIVAITRRLPQHPLACYIFSSSRQFQEEIVNRVSFGGGCINHCIMHLGNPNLPFGGAGQSGMGSYHGFAGFRQFSHEKSIFSASVRLDVPLLYAPYRNKIRLLKKFLNYL